MAEVVVIEFAAPQAVEMYRKVNGLLGVDPSTGRGDWPAALLHHVAGESGASLVVVEVWESREAQHEFMTRLQAAFEEAGAPPPTRVEWFNLAGQMHRG